MPGIPLPALDEAVFWQQKTERRTIQEMFTKKLDLIASITSVVGATGGTSGLIKITAADHGLTTGDEVIIADVGGTTNANGYFTVTVIDTATFTLDGTTFAIAWTGGGSVCNGVSYLVNVANTSGGAAPSSPGVMVVNNIKQINTSGAVVATPQVIKQVLVNTDVEIMLGDSSYGQAVSSLIITNISGAEVTGSVKIRTTVAMAIAAQVIIPFVLPDDYSLVIGGDGVRSMYKNTGLPYVS